VGGWVREAEGLGDEADGEVVFWLVAVVVVVSLLFVDGVVMEGNRVVEVDLGKGDGRMGHMVVLLEGFRFFFFYGMR
jgi:hypothetical protein